MKNILLFGIFLIISIFHVHAQRSHDLYVHRNTPGVCMNPFGRHIIDHNGQIHLLVGNKFCSQRCEAKYGHIYRPMPFTSVHRYCTYHKKYDVIYIQFNDQIYCKSYFYDYVYPYIITWENYR